MNAALINKCDLLVKNRTTVQNVFPWDYPELHLAAAAVYTGQDMQADPEKLKACLAILKENAGIFSEYRSYVKMPLLCKMTLAEDPEQYLRQIQSITDQMKGIALWSGDYRVLAAMTIYEHVDPDGYAAAIARTADVYQEMKKNHPWITSGEDIPLAAVLAVSDVDKDALSAEMENCYQTLHERFYDANAVQSLSHVLAADPADAAQKCAKVEELFDLLKGKGHKYGSGPELSVLGVLAMLGQPAETVVDDIVEADDYLKTQKGFGDFVMGPKIRRMYAALMTLNTVVPSSSAATSSVVECMVSIVIAMEILTTVMICSMCVSSSSH